MSRFGEGATGVEVTTTVQNTVLDHRLRVLFPTNIAGETCLSDSNFDVVERKLQLAPDNAIRKELDVETRPHFTWTAMADAAGGLAVITRGLPEVAVCDDAEKPIALTLLRAFRRAVLSNDNMGGQIQGTHMFRYDIEPFVGSVPRKKFCIQGQRVHSTVRQVDLLPIELAQIKAPKKIPPEQSFLKVEGDAVVTAIQRQDRKLQIRLFNPNSTAVSVRVSLPERLTAICSVTLEGVPDAVTDVTLADGAAKVELPGKRIATLLVE